LAEHVFETFFNNMDTERSCHIKKNTHRMIILCQSGFKEQIKKLGRLLLCTTKNCSQKDKD